MTISVNRGQDKKDADVIIPTKLKYELIQKENMFILGVLGQIANMDMAPGVYTISHAIRIAQFAIESINERRDINSNRKYKRDGYKTK